jgi:hypothetical protein
MVIRLDENYNAMTSTALLGYVGETNARPVSVEGMEIDGADRYVMTIDYGDGVTYEVDITGGQWTPTADILRSAQTVSCQIAAKKLSGDEYVLVKKSRIFRLRIGTAIGDTAIPSPDVSMDALDRISAIGEQVEADVERAENAASTAMQAAENAKKSATATEKSADTAEQAAERAETAKTAAETSATQADTARQGAENARQQAVTSQNNAKISAAQASAAAQQTEADKTITAGYAKTAKTNADSTAADRQAVQEMATQVTADKATVADHAAQVATDRKAAETAAQTAQSIADSLPDDYVTAVGKIAENTAEIANVKLTDKELKRRVDALYSIGQGITHQFETDTDTAYTKTVPTGAKLMSVKSVGGRSIVFNQSFQPRKEANNGATATADSDGTITINGTTTASYINFRDVTPEENKIGKYAFKLLILNNPDNINMKYGFLNRGQSTPVITSGSSAVICNQTQSEILLGKSTGISGFAVGTVFNDVKIKIQIFDLTAMFGSGNEPTTAEEFEKIFPADYYPYNAGEVVSAGTEEVTEQGKNLLVDSTLGNVSVGGAQGITVEPYGDAIKVEAVSGNGNWVRIRPDNVIKTYMKSGDKYVFLAEIKSQNATKPPMVYIQSIPGYVNLQGAVSTDYSWCYHIGTWVYNPNEKEITLHFGFMNAIGTYYIRRIMFIKGDTPTAYAPFHRNVYQIPEAIKALPGYGWSAGTARNYVDYENKKYVQCVGSVDLGTLNWGINTTSTVGNHFYAPAKHLNFKYLGAFGTTIYNALCSKYRTVARSSNVFVDKTLAIDGVTVVSQIQVKDTAYTDAAAFKQAMSGVILYYELATPIVTDISTVLPDDFLRNIEVEAGGSITFKNSNGDDYRIPVPSEEEYVVKLSEVGGTT